MRRKLNPYERAYIRKIKKIQREAEIQRKKMLRKTRKRKIKKINFFSSQFFSFLLFLSKKTNFILKKGFHHLQKQQKKIKEMKQKEKKEKIKRKKQVSSLKKHHPKNIQIKKTQNKKNIHHRSYFKTKTKKKKSFRFLKFFFGSLFIIFILAAAGLSFYFSSLEIPSIDNFSQRKIVNSTKIYDRTGEILLYDIHQNIQRTVVPSNKISKHIKDAIVAIEDHDFYHHKGVVWKSTIRAAFQTLLAKLGFPSRGPAGGSTLTQQMIKNTLLTREKTITRKMKEWILAYKIEKKLSKDEILTTYLNEAPYGGTIYGVQEAARIFFGKAASDVSLAEAAYLAAIPNLPTYYSPYGKHRDELKKRQRLVLSEMKKYHFISDDEYQKAILEKVHFLPKEEHYAKALHFVQYVKSILEKKYGEDVVENGGLRVITTLDYKLQKQAEHIIKKHIEEIGKDMHASNAALVAIESKTGDIITMVGSRDYFDTKDFDGNFNVALSPRQPGSSFKPLAYATAFEKGYLPETVLFDVQTQFNARCRPDDISTGGEKGCYSPKNWDNKFKGPISLRNALAQSRNIPAIKILYLAGIKNVIKKAREAGIKTLNKNPSFYGLGLVLGGGEVTLLDLTSAYTTFANEGRHVQAHAIKEIRDIHGKVLEKTEPRTERVFSRNVARMISSILSDNEARTPLYGAHSGLYFGNKSVAGKTGTTNDKRDAWMMGYTSDVAVGVWTGNNDNSPMKKGSKLSIKPWHEFMQLILDTDRYQNKAFKNYEVPENFSELKPMLRGDWMGGKTYTVDLLSGKLATEYTPEDSKKTFTYFDPHTILHWVNKNNPLGPGNSRNDPQYKNWEFGVQKFVHEHYQNLFDNRIEIPTEYDDVHGPDGLIQNQNQKFDLQIEGIDSDKHYQKDDNIQLKVWSDDLDDDEFKKVSFFVNNTFLADLEKAPFIFNLLVSDIPYLKEKNLLRVVGEAKNGDKVIQDRIIFVQKDSNGQENE